MRSLSAILLLAVAFSGWSVANGRSKEPAPRAHAAASGKQVFDRWCTACHAPGARYPGTASLAAKYGKDIPAALEERTDLTPELVSYFVRHGVASMPPFRKTEITDAEMEALGRYLSRQAAR